jgi:5-methyltetrahydropteroyltriglutamate--homocysteine methyltransferase
MAFTASLGYPRFGKNRELKRALEEYWSGKIGAAGLLEAGKQLRLTHWHIQQNAGIDIIPSNDFSFYDQVLDTSCMVGAIPPRFSQLDDLNGLDQYFAMARGIQRNDLEIPAMEMTKWFDTNYHYIVPEIGKNQIYRYASTKVIDEYVEAKNAGINTRPVLLGPVSYLLLSKASSPDFTTLDTLPGLVSVYIEILQRLAAVGADWVQIDEPCLVLDLDEAARSAYTTAYNQLDQVENINIMVATYFGGLEDNLSMVANLPAAGLHVDLVRAPQQLESVLALLPDGKILSVGVIDGRNVWRTDLDAAFAQIQQAVSARNSDAIQIAPSCSLMFSPYDLELETELDSELYSWLAFAHQKLDELVLLKQAVNQGVDAVAGPFLLNRTAVEGRRSSERAHNPLVRARLAAVDESMLRRNSDFETRKGKQAQRLSLPLLPTTTIGSFPQTSEVRAQRAAKNNGSITEEAYNEYLKAEIARTIRLQEEIGLDVLVHGEFERSDMVEYFGEQLTGIAFTQHGWVQSYGSRGVRPPIIYGDVARPAPMTVSWSVYAQSLTRKPVKGMLTGPVTMMEWSFVRDDQPRVITCQQIALAMRDEVLDLERAGMRVIQIDEPAFREGLPLRRAEQEYYLQWAIDCFKLASSGVRDETQIHTHMCYAEFNDIIEAIGRMDADVISIEASRSKMELLDTFNQFQYPGDIGPGIYDIHSPNVPSQAEIGALIAKAAQVVPIKRLWINPDCGLKTRRWEEVIPSLEHILSAVRAYRESLKESRPSYS